MTQPTLKELNPTFQVEDFKYESKLEEDLFINRNDLSDEFARHSERYAFYCTCFELASSKVELYEINLERLYAILDAEKRQDMLNSQMKSTEKMIENMVITDAKYVALQEETLELKKHTAL